MFHAVRLNSETYPPEPIEAQELFRAGAKLTEIEGQTSEEIIRAAADCDALLVVSAKIPQEVILQLRRCRVISRLGAGTDRIDVDAATQAGIVVANVPDFCVPEQAEHTMALLLASARHLPYMFSAMRRGEWTARSHPDVHRVSGQTLTLLGFGSSARAVAVRASAFGLRLVAWVRNPAKYERVAREHGVELLPLEQSIEVADFLSIHLPLNDETRGLLNRERIARLKATAIVINTARGAIIDENALADALRDRRIRGAALDVFHDIDVFRPPGPPPDHPFFQLENVLMTPHCAGSSVESTLDSKTRGARNAAMVLCGFWPAHIVNPAVVPRDALKTADIQDFGTSHAVESI